MRKMFKAIAALLPMAAVALPQAASAEAWRQSCSGPEFVCGSAAAPAKTSAPKIAKLKTTAPAAKTVKAKVKSPAAVASADKPVKAKKKAVAATKPKSKAKVADAAVKAKPKAKTAKASQGGGNAYQTGVASWYGGNFHGRKTANGETYNMNAWTAAHKTLPFGTRVRVTNTRNGDTVDVRINDRGPFIAGRIIDLSRAAAADIGVTNSGVAPVKITILGKG